MQSLRLGVNVDHIATIRNARGGEHPDPVQAAELAIDAGADGITAHLREDRRHIRDEDIARLKQRLTRPLNLEMAPTEEMLGIALKTRPNACCLVPERRAERTTESGLDVRGLGNSFADYIARLKDAGIRVSLFVDADEPQLDASSRAGADIVELHTGTYCEAAQEKDAGRVERELARLVEGARIAAVAGLEVHAGHGLTFDMVGPVAAMPQIVELNIGHFLVGEAIFVGLAESVRRMKMLMTDARLAAGRK
jgi:pyridoxine 5-phosphate synthase